jgi:pimeloyl-ACP methyl ester carboxylesterase
MNKFLIGLVVVFILLWLPYFIKTYGLKTITEDNLPNEGAWAQLDEGNLYYRWYEPETSNNEIVVLVHGFSTPHFVWNGLKGFLLDSGYRVLVYDHFGRGFSEKPDIPYDKNLFVNSLRGLLDHQMIEKPVHLVGYSMGGPVVAHFTKAYPKSVKSMALIAPAGFMNESPSAYMWSIKPLIGEWFWNIFGTMIVFQGNEEDGSPARSDPLALSKEDFISQARYQMQFKGFINALLSTVRNFNLFDAEKVFTEIGKLNIPTLTIWGTEDVVVPFQGSDGLINSIPHSELFIIKGGQHDVTFAEPTEVGRAIRDFLNKQPKHEV